MRLVFLATMVLALLGACRPGAPAAEPGTTPSEPAEEASPSVAGHAADLPVARCSEVPRISAPASWYRDEPVYVGNEQPVEEVRAWAAGQPGFEEIWLDRDHNGWITLAFSQDAEERQAELQERFPDVGAVAVQVDWTMDELIALQQRVSDELRPLLQVGSGIYVMQGVVGIGIGVLHPDRVAIVAERFAGERICVEGLEVADAPVAGPQQPDGDGWRLLAAERGAGGPYRTGIATDAGSFLELWRLIGLEGEPPSVDFETEVVIWFGAVYGSSCPNLRLDDVVIDEVRALVHAEIANLDAGMACTGDANAFAYVVALDRSRLPTGPFAIQLDAADPPSGVPEERTLVHVDLSSPGAVAGPGDIGFDPELMEPRPNVVEPGGIVEPGYPSPYRFSVRCGIEWLGRLNGVEWRAAVPAGTSDFVPAAWRDEVDPETGWLTVEVLMSDGPEPTLAASLAGHEVIYRPTSDEPPVCP